MSSNHYLKINLPQLNQKLLQQVTTILILSTKDKLDLTACLSVTKSWILEIKKRKFCGISIQLWRISKLLHLKWTSRTNLKISNKLNHFVKKV
jgi:hypothetical protein